MSAPATVHPPRCLTCRRPRALCWCRGLAAVPTRTRVVILQHPREHTMKMGTARLAHVGLAGAELHVGVRFDEHPRVRALAAAPRGTVALLYPGAGATPVDALTDLPQTLVVVDGTWITARKMLARNRLLQALPRVSLRPVAPSAYRIRREPAAHCLSTIEAVVAALAVLEGDPHRFAPLLAAFERLVATQLRYATTRRVPHHHERKQRRPRRASVLETVLAASPGRVVLAQAEGNPHETGGPHELVQLVALRPSSGERFAMLVRPRHPVAAYTPARLGLDAAMLAGAASLDELRRAWGAFLRPDDVLVGWGEFTPAVLAVSDVTCPSWSDLRGEVARRLGRRGGGADRACGALGATPEAAFAPGRAGVRVAALAGIVATLADPTAPRRPDTVRTGLANRATTG